MDGAKMTFKEEETKKVEESILALFRIIADIIMGRPCVNMPYPLAFQILPLTPYYNEYNLTAEALEI